MSPLLLSASAAIYLLASPWFTTAGNTASIAAFKVLPTLLGAAMAFHSYAQFMGWPA